MTLSAANVISISADAASSSFTLRWSASRAAFLLAARCCSRVSAAPSTPPNAVVITPASRGVISTCHTISSAGGVGACRYLTGIFR